MPSFILRNLDPDFWARVQRKAADEGTPIKAVILRLLAAWLGVVILVFSTACAQTLPTAPTLETPGAQAGVAARIELNTASGFGPEAGTGTITARVFDGLGTALANQAVTFSASAGTLEAPSVVTDADGRARTTITADPGAVTITATAGAIEQRTLVAIQAPPPPPPPSAPPVLNPTPTPTPPPTPAPTPAPVVLAVALTSDVSTVAVTPPVPPATTGTSPAVTFTATVTNVSTGDMVTAYQWDLNGDGTFEATSAGPALTSTKIAGPDFYQTHGIVTPKVKVTTSKGSTATATATLVVTN